MAAAGIRVLINALHAKSGGGVTYLREILPRLADDDRLELHVLIDASQIDILQPYDERVRAHIVGLKPGWWRLLLWEQLVLPIIIRDMKVDAVFSPANFGVLAIGKQAILLRNAFAVARNERRLSKQVYWLVLTIATLLSILRCRRVLAVSHYALNTLSMGLNRWWPDKMAVVHHGASKRFSPSDNGRERFLLAVSDIYVQKNFQTLVRALAKVRQVHPDLRLLISGATIDHWYYGELDREIHDLGLAGAVEFLGRRPQEALVDLYRRCLIFVFPSTAETFGIPLIEAMACGAVVVSSNSTAMPEVVGDAARLFSPDSVEELTTILLELLNDEEQRRRLSAAAIERARPFSWEECARRTVDELVKLAGRAG